MLGSKVPAMLPGDTPGVNTPLVPMRGVSASGDPWGDVRDNNTPWARTPDRGEIADVTNGTDATYYYQLNTATWNNRGIQWTIGQDAGSVTLTFEASWDPVNDYGSVTNWEDVSTELGSASGWTASNKAIDNTGILSSPTYVRVKVVAATTANTGDWWTVYGQVWN